MAKICVVLATYNGEKYLAQMLDSLMNQSRKADLVVAVDDGSKDSSVEILKSYVGKLPLEIEVHSENQGHRAAFGRALEIADSKTSPTDLIALADQDDIWHAQKLETLEKAILDKIGFKADLVYGDAQIIDSEGGIVAKSWRLKDHIDVTNSMARQIAGINNVTGCLSLFSAELLKDILPIPANVTVHDRWIAMLALRRRGVKSIPDVVLSYRIHENNAVGGKAAPAMSITLETQVKWLKMILENKDILRLKDKEILFTQKLLKITEQRQRHHILPHHLPWLFAHRKDLFLQEGFAKNLKRVLFSTIGLPLAKKLWGKT